MEATPPPSPKRPRRKDEDLPTSYLPTLNIPARRAYQYAVAGLVPVVGLAAGPIATINGIMGIRLVSRKPEVGGRAHALVGVWLGAAEFLTNAVGLAMVAHGLGWV